MPRTQQGITLTTTPVQVDTADDDSIAFRDLTISCQTAGNVTFCEDAESYATGARFTVVAGQVFTFSRIQGNEDVWVASSDGVEIDVYETGVA